MQGKCGIWGVAVYVFLYVCPHMYCCVCMCVYVSLRMCVCVYTGSSLSLSLPYLILKMGIHHEVGKEVVHLVYVCVMYVLASLLCKSWAGVDSNKIACSL